MEIGGHCPLVYLCRNNKMERERNRAGEGKREGGIENEGKEKKKEMESGKKR